MEQIKIGEQMANTLKNLECAIYLVEQKVGGPHGFTDEGLRSASKIFITAVMDKMYELQQKENMDWEDRKNMVCACGDEFRNLVKKYTDIDTHEL